MKKLMTIAFAACAFGAMAGADDVLISFSTPGVDTYRDGSKVLDGECYALVYQAPEQTGAVVFNADGTADNGSLVLVAPLAKDGKCPPVVFEIDKAKFDANYKTGTFGVYLFDTRVKSGSTVALAPLDPKTHFPTALNNTVAATEAKGTDGQNTRFEAVAAIDGAVSVATAVETPKISAMNIDGARVTITVQGMSPVATYGVVTGTTITGLGAKVDATRDGDTFTFDAPANGNLFKVVGEKNF